MEERVRLGDCLEKRGVVFDLRLVLVTFFWKDLRDIELLKCKKGICCIRKLKLVEDSFSSNMCKPRGGGQKMPI